MKNNPQLILNIVFLIEVVLFSVAAYGSRQYLDSIAQEAQFSPLLSFGIKTAALLGIIGLAILTHTLVTRFLRGKGLLD
jgi:hypothetical protein